MEAKLSFSSRLSIALILIGVAGCTTTSKHPRGAQPPTPQASPAPAGEVMGPPEPKAEPMGPQPLPSTEPAAVYGPEPIQYRPVVLVLSSGQARGFAHEGALRALADAKIPIGAILGTEMGALVGGLYALDGNINHLEWALLRFKDEFFVRGGGYFSEFFEKSARTAKLTSELHKVFGEKDVDQCRIPLRIAVQGVQPRMPIIISNGPAWEAVRAAVTLPDVHEPAKWKGTLVMSAAEAKPLLVEEARALGIGPVVVIDVRPGGAAALAQDPALKDVDLVIRPDLRGVGEKDFAKRTEAAFRGKRAILENLREIRHWVGLPLEDTGANPSSQNGQIGKNGKGASP